MLKATVSESSMQLSVAGTVGGLKLSDVAAGWATASILLPFKGLTASLSSTRVYVDEG